MKTSLPIFLLAFLCFSCLDEISLRAPDNTLDSIMIRGKLVHGTPSRISVSISDLSDFVKFDSPNPISEAEVILNTENGNSLEIPMTAAGLYEMEIGADNPAIRIAIGQSYQVAVSVPGKGNYESTFEPIIAVPVIDAIHKNVIEREILDESERIENKSFIEFLVDTPLKNQGDTVRSFLKWDFEGAYRFLESSIVENPDHLIDLCYYFDKLNLDKVSIFNGNRANQSILSNHLILEEPLDYRFFAGFYLTVFQESLSESAFQYWEQISKVIDLNGSFFEALPAKVIGNFTQVDNPDELVFGYFYATVQDTLRVYISPSESKFPRAKCRVVLTTPEHSGLPQECQDCLTKKGSTLDKPDFWVE